MFCLLFVTATWLEICNIRFHHFQKCIPDLCSVLSCACARGAFIVVAACSSVIVTFSPVAACCTGFCN